MTGPLLPPHVLANLKVLVVDADKGSRRITSELLRSLGVQTTLHAATGKEALREIDLAQPQVMFTERLLSEDMDGVALARWIRTDEHSASRDMPIIMITANVTREDLFAAREAGVTEFIVKPINVGVVASRLSAALLQPREFVRSEDYAGPSRRRGARGSYNGQDRRGRS